MSVLSVLAESIPEQRETLADGSYIVTVLSDAPPPFGDGLMSAESAGIFDVITRMLQFLRQLIWLLSGTRTVSKTKYVNYYDSNGTLLWTVALQADFTWNREQATCVSASARHSVFDEDWGIVRAQAEKAGNTAAGYFAVRQVKLGVPLKTIERTLTLTCDADGNVT